ncbi:MAG: aspartate kinase [Bacteroidetes bacterium]|nr:aspartate kinase [Bacteroidota bacterium]MBS1650160.1 aspartate kinase [Bacteroidota bacterium]
MKVFKFGGASVNNVERIQNIPNILQQYKNENLVIIISAMGKTTNALEKVAEAFYNNNQTTALELFNIVKHQHLNTTKYLLLTNYNACIAQLNDFFTEIEWLLHDKPIKEFDYYYDQIVCIGELLSTAIISHYLNEVNITNTWLDVRDIIKTDNNFRDANVDWKQTTERTKTINNKIQTAEKPTIFLTQGFIGCTDENESTTLGREGSDYTASIFANLLNAENLTIWKDVEGVMNADPKEFSDATLINELNFNEVIEMAYYGAQVIHPKTIKPLQNKNIPLHVKCFLNSSLPGTIIHNKQIKKLPPITVIKKNQTLIHLSSIDFSFVGEQPMAILYNNFNELKLKPNLIQTGAINVQVCIDDKNEKIEKLAFAINHLFEIQVEKDLTLLTIRHYNQTQLQQLIEGKEIVLIQQTKTTIQILYK